VDPELRTLFDEQLELLLPDLPQQVRDFMERVPLVVEDHPSEAVMRKMRIRNPADLYGLYTGVPLNKRSVEHSGVPSDVIHIFRLGILRASRRRGLPGYGIDETRLREQIRRTILHEYGHHVGMTERELRELGYG
jgi:predicted Zn-dependent protease with MMP-like domain